MLKNATGWLCGGVVTQRIANPCTPVRFRPEPPTLLISHQISMFSEDIGGIA